jgi:TusA-related sulfurtransferase
MTELHAARLDEVAPTRRLDMRGETCPTTTNETLRRLEEMAPGEVLEVESDYYPAKTTIPYHCEKRGYPFVFLDEDKPTWRIKIRKAGKEATNG